jgi:uncharacterized cupredoxin-like copper-binding protein
VNKTLLITGLLVFLLSACGGSAPQSVNEVTLQLTDFAYSSPSFTIPAGEPVTLTLINNGAVEHDFVIENVNVEFDLEKDGGSTEHHAHGMQENYDLHISAMPSKTSVAQITIDEPGIYKFFCSVEGHLEAGMTGELTVVSQDETSN